MEGQGRILQQRIERAPLDRGLKQSHERVGGKDGVGQEQDAKATLAGHHD